jgi:hypothetical protein
MKRKLLTRDGKRRGGAWARLLLCACLCLAAAALARNSAARQADALFPFSKGGKWGFVDAGGRVRIAPRFESAAAFSDGLARVTVEGQPAFVNPAGEVVFRPQFDLAGDFSDGLAYVETGWKVNPKIGLTIEPGRWGFVDKTGRLAIPLNFTRAYDFSEGLAAVQMGQHLAERSGFIDTTGKVVFEFPFDVSWGFQEGFALVRTNGGMFYLDRAGKKLTTPAIDDYEARSFSEGLAAVQIKGQWGYIDKTGRLAIEPRFEDAGDFYGGLAAVKLTVEESRYVTCPMDEQGSTRTSTKLYGYIDKTGRLVVPPQFEYAGPFSEGLANVSNCFKPFFIDRTGKVALRVPFDDASPFHEGLAQVLRYEQGGARSGYIDKTGKVVWEPSR